MNCKSCGYPIMARFEDPMVYVAGDGWYCGKCIDKQEYFGDFLRGGDNNAGKDYENQKGRVHGQYPRRG